MSRYGSQQHTVFTGTESCSVKTEAVPEVMKNLRKAFDSDKTRSRAWRLDQLNAMLRMLREGQKELQDAMLKDLHKSPFESILTEIGFVENEVVEAIEKLDEWMSPKYTKTSALNWPASSYTVPDPLGVVLVMGAWNYPVNLTLSPVVGAIAGGNCVLIRPGSYSVHTSHAMCRLVDKYLDKECIRIAEGDRHLTTAILKERFDSIFFTGSGFIGKMVAEAAAKNLTPCILELGGKSPTIIDKSAHLEHAAERVCWATFLNSGQTCVRPDFVLMHEDVADEFLKLVKAKIKLFYGEDASKTEFFGRVINAKAFERLQGLITKGQSQLVCGGKTDASERYVEPSVFDFGSNLDAFLNHPLMQDEIFGPLLPCARYKSNNQVIDFIRRLPTGKPLACYCFAKDKEVQDLITSHTTSGGLCVNDAIMHLANTELPFGGVGDSGMGAYHGHRTFTAFTHEKAVLKKYTAIDKLPGLGLLLDARFPGYTGFKQLLVHIFSNRLVMKAVNPPVASLRKFIMQFVALYVILRLRGYKLKLMQ